jgi:truncated hemoglobin YjbI
MQCPIKKEILEFYENGDEERSFWQRLFPGRKERLRNEAMKMKERMKQYLGGFNDY